MFDLSPDHEWEKDREYDLPDPDPRNPITVYVCERCGLERHHGPPKRYVFGDEDITDSVSDHDNCRKFVSQRDDEC